MEDQEVQQHLDALLGTIQQEQRSPQEQTLQAMAMLGLRPGNSLELRISSKKFCDPADLAQRVVNAMFARLCVYPTSIAAHSTVAALLEASETVIKAQSDNAMLQMAQEALYGKDFLAKPIHVEVDDSLDTKTIAARFKVDLDSEEYKEAMKSMMMRLINEGKL